MVVATVLLEAMLRDVVEPEVWVEEEMDKEAERPEQDDESREAIVTGASGVEVTVARRVCVRLDLAASSKRGPSSSSSPVSSGSVIGR